MTTNIREQIFPKSNLFSPGNGRDYLKTTDGEIFSINGLYCDAAGNIDRWGAYVRIIDIRWTVVVWRDCSIGLNADCSYKTERRLIFTGDAPDEEILPHYGYRIERDSRGYENVLPIAEPAAAPEPTAAPVEPAAAPLLSLPTEKIDITQYLIPGMIACRGGRSGRKIHKAYSGSSVTMCGHWLRHNADNFRVHETHIAKFNLCEKCY